MQLLNSNVPKGQGFFVHSRHAVDPETSEYVPVPQSAQTVDDEAEDFPAPQSEHAVAPTAVEYLPVSQLVQTVDPSFSEYVPSRQSVQAAAAEEVAPGWLYLPTAHKKPEHVEASAVAWNLPASQSVQTVAPEPATEYFPAPQAVQV